MDPLKALKNCFCVTVFKPTADSDKYPKFSMSESQFYKSHSISELFKHVKWIQLIKKFQRFPKDPGPEY